MIRHPKENELEKADMFNAKAASFQYDVECNQITPELQQFVVPCLQSENSDHFQVRVGYGHHNHSGYAVTVKFSRGIADRYPYLNNKLTLHRQDRGGAPIRLNVLPANLIPLLSAQQANAPNQIANVNFTC